MRRFRRAADWWMGIRGDYDEEARRILRRCFWIGFGSIFDLSGRLTDQRWRANMREWQSYLARECPPIDGEKLLDRVIEDVLNETDPSERDELRRKFDEIRGRVQ